MSKITIIVPVYNTEKFLDRCITSLINQTYKDLEIILVDDGSVDSSLKICKDFESKDDRIKVIHKENGGQGSARNLALDIASGDYIGFVDSDDFIHPRFYEILMNLLVDKDADIVCCHYQFINPDAECEFDEIDYDTILSSGTILETNEFLSQFENYYHAVSWISPCTKIYKRELFDGVRYPQGVIDEDSYILHHIIGNSKKMFRIKTPLYYYVWSQGSTSRSDFSAKRFHKNGCNLDRVKFFKERKMNSQVYYFERLYLIEVLKMYYNVKNNYPEFLGDYKPYLKEYKKNLKSFLSCNNRICRMERVIFRIFAVSPKLAEKLYNKYLA